MQAGVTATSGNIQHTRLRRKCDVGERGFHIADIRKDIMIGAVTLALPGKLRLSGKLNCV
jgi:hypothetical protein